MSGFIVFQPVPIARTPTPTLFVTDGCSEAVTAYPAASNGDVSNPRLADGAECIRASGSRSQSAEVPSEGHTGTGWSFDTRPNPAVALLSVSFSHAHCQHSDKPEGPASDVWNQLFHLRRLHLRHGSANWTRRDRHPAQTQIPTECPKCRERVS